MIQTILSPQCIVCHYFQIDDLQYFQIIFKRHKKEAYVQQIYGIYVCMYDWFIHSFIRQDEVIRVDKERGWIGGIVRTNQNNYYAVGSVNDAVLYLYLFVED